MFGVVGGGVNNDDVVCEVVVLHVGECALKCECFVFYDVLFLWFVVLSVDVVEFCLNFVCCCIFIVAVMIKSYSAVVVVVVVVFVGGRRCSMS